MSPCLITTTGNSVGSLDDASIRLVITLLGMGFIPTLVLTWVFELNLRGLKNETEIDRSLTRRARWQGYLRELAANQA